MVACNRGKIMQKCKKMMALIMVFALCFGLSACGGGGSDNNDTVENEDDRCSDGSESDIYDSTDTVQYMSSKESAEDNPANRNMKSLCRMIVTIRLPRGIGILMETGTA